MDIYTYAIDMEKESEAYYREMGQHCGNTGLQAIFELLANEEVKHRQVLEAMRDDSDAEMVDSGLLAQAQEIFAGIKARNELACDIDQVNTYRKAQEIEEKTRSHYLAKAEQADTAEATTLFERIADEELKHYRLLEGIIQFVTKPEQWLEDAEWNHLEQF